ncbi:uncharacterized protein FIBRA_07108 [Fibroporia radiculosa]|uniref:Uncharacterized protein n=1 Tax=Fibroporia radiculosa TaxID=599839 RepID=J4IBM3_9APHY|nr:uncharacterized protein FIBRA_07108 [Fibroporia radiculosa]CCM04911.1 predicted protein [Fibroporia radiculosa]
MLTSTENNSVVDDDSEDDFDWEEVAVPQYEQQPKAVEAEPANEDVQEGPSEKPHIEITIQTQRKGKKSSQAKPNPRAEQLYAERLARLTCHQVHTVCLLANARIRNKWLNDALLHVRRAFSALRATHAHALV